MKRTRLNNIFFRVFILLISINVSCSVLPGGIVQNYGLFGELSSVIAVENQVSTIQEKLIKENKRYKSIINKEQQRLQYMWLFLTVIILSIHYLYYWLIFLNYETPVLLKVRMNN